MESLTGQARNADQVGPKGIWTAEALAERLRDLMATPAAIVCIGNDLRGDDGAGQAVGAALGHGGPWYVYRVGIAPESFLMKIAANKPQVVVVIDALDFDAAPGAVEVLDMEAIRGAGPSTHGPSPETFVRALRMVHPCRCVIVGIQPKSTEFGQGLSPQVTEAAQRVAEGFGLLARS